MKRLLPLLLLLTLSATAEARLLVLVHGWASGPDSWRQSGAMAALQQRGWGDAGLVVAEPGGVRWLSGPGSAQRDKLVRAALPASAPLPLQAQLLTAELAELRRRFPDEPITLAGHSAGGIVARLVLVGAGGEGVERLVTIASPNLGTPEAFRGLEIADGRPVFCPGPGFDMMKSFFGGDDYRYLRDSRPLLHELQPAAPGTLLDWLNRQPHPAIDYHAIVRAGDSVVPPPSQPLNAIAGIGGGVTTHPGGVSHDLHHGDGILLGSILDY